MDRELPDRTVDATPILQIEDLAVTYATRSGEVHAVPAFSLTLHKGESFGLVGESGCGKTSVAMAIMRYLGANGRIDRGRILFEGRDLATLPSSELRRIRGRRIAMVYQEPMSALNPCMTIEDQLVEVLKTHEGASRREARERSHQVLQDVRMPDPEQIMRRYPHQISGGQQQRIVIAMALLSNPALLLLDEPTSSLDATVEAAVVDLLAELRQKYDTALLYISHNLGLILRVCDRVGVMYSGEIVEDGPVRDLFIHPRHPYTSGLIACIPTLGETKEARTLVPIRGQVSLPNARPAGCFFGPRCDHFVAGRCDDAAVALDLIEPATSHHVRCLRWREIDTRIIAPRAYARGSGGGGQNQEISVEHLSKVYETRDTTLSALLSGTSVQRVQANEDLTFAVLRGRTLAVVGESGCGKSTLAKVLTGLEIASDGVIEFRGQNIAFLRVNKRQADLRRALQMIFQNPDRTLNPSHTIGRTIARVLTKFGIAKGQRQIDQQVRELLEFVRLPEEFASRKPRQLSGGQKQRVAVARAFAGKPAVVICDEPVSALDVSVQAAVINLLMDIQSELETTLIFISHDLGLVRYIADDLIVMYLGKIMEAGPNSAVFEPPYHPYTEALLSAVPNLDAAETKSRIRLEGAVPSLVDLPTGCRFATRCPRRLGSICDTTPPPVHRLNGSHSIACHIPPQELGEMQAPLASVQAN